MFLLEELVKGVSPSAAGRLAILAGVFLRAALSGGNLEPRPPGAT